LISVRLTTISTKTAAPVEIRAKSVFAKRRPESEPVTTALRLTAEARIPSAVPDACSGPAFWMERWRDE
jgi:hypothetical protein